MTTIKVECDFCHGEGEIWTMHRNPQLDFVQECGRCFGAGTIEREETDEEIQQRADEAEDAEELAELIKEQARELQRKK